MYFQNEPGPRLECRLDDERADEAPPIAATTTC